MAPLATTIPELNNDKILFCHECFVIVVTIIPLGMTPVTTGIAALCGSSKVTGYEGTFTTTYDSKCCRELRWKYAWHRNSFNEHWLHMFTSEDLYSFYRRKQSKPWLNTTHTHTHSVPCSLYHLRPHWCTQCSLLPRRHVITFVWLISVRTCVSLCGGDICRGTSTNKSNKKMNSKPIELLLSMYLCTLMERQTATTLCCQG